MSLPVLSPVTLPTDAVEIVDGHAVTTSLKIAEIFGRNHKDVLRAIRDLSATAPKAFHGRNFAPVDYRDEKGESRPAYNITRDGFVLLVMGFTGRLATAFKIAYIERFNAQEAALADRAPAITHADLDAIEARSQARLDAAEDILAEARRAQRVTVTTARQTRARDSQVTHLQGVANRLHAHLAAAYRLILRDPLLADIAEWHPKGLSAAKLAKLHDTDAATVTDLADQIRAAGLVLDDGTRAGLGLPRIALVTTH